MCRRCGQSGRRFVPPGERPSMDVAIGMGQSDPARAPHPRPRGRRRGRSAPRVTVEVGLGRVCEMLVRSGRAHMCVSGRNRIENRLAFACSKGLGMSLASA
jgi:hypothetical protein